MAEEQAQWVTVRAAVKLTGISERTVRRRIREGAWPSRQGATGLEVDIGGMPMAQAEAEQAPQAEAAPVAGVAELQAELRHCQAMLDAVTAERDYLRVAHAAALRALPSGTEQAMATSETSTSKPRASWWQRLWGRD